MDRRNPGEALHRLRGDEERAPVLTRARRLVRGREGQALVEVALVVPLLFLIIMATIELGRAMDLSHALASLSREGANLASRGTNFPQVLGLVMEHGTEIGLQRRGGVVATRVVVDSTGTPRVEAQSASTGYADRSHIGRVGQPAPAFTGLQLRQGQSLFVVETFYSYEPVAGLDFLASLVPAELYERSVF